MPIGDGALEPLESSICMLRKGGIGFDTSKKIIRGVICICTNL